MTNIEFLVDELRKAKGTIEEQDRAIAKLKNDLVLITIKFNELSAKARHQAYNTTFGDKDALAPLKKEIDALAMLKKKMEEG